MSWIEILGAAICGGVGGVLGALLGRVLFGSTRPGTSSRRQVGRLALLVAGGALGAQVLGPVAADAWADAQARTPSQKFERTTAKLSASPEVRARAREMQARGLSPEEASIEGRKTGVQGIARLSDAELLARTRIVGRGVGLVDSHTCASIARGVAGWTELATVLDALGENEAQELATIAGHATLAEIRQTPAARPATSEDDVTRILESVAAHSGEDGVAAVKRVFASDATDDEVCSGTRILYATLPRVDAVTQPRLAMMLAGL
jgi:hypothetical protein